MKNLTKSVTIFIAWFHFVMCIAPFPPCYGVTGDERDQLSNLRHTVTRSSTLTDQEPPVQSTFAGFVQGLKTLTRTPVLFVATLFSPTDNLEDAEEFYKNQGKTFFETSQEQLTQVRNEGILGYTASKGKALSWEITNHPLDTIIYSGAIVLGWTDLGETFPAIPLMVATASNLKLGLDLKGFASSIRGITTSTKVMKAALGGTVICLVSSVPVGAALEWTNYAAAKNYYNGGLCPDNPWKSIITPASACLREGRSLGECHALIPSEDITGEDLYVFTRHPTTGEGLDPVSVVKLNEGGKTCFYTALTPNSPVTETCFPNLRDPGTRIVQANPSMTLAKAHEGLRAGQSMRHIGLHLEDGTGCGTFHEAPALYNLGGDSICVLTALKSGGDVTQMCFDPANPETLTLKKNDDVSLIFTSNDDPRPVSVVIKNSNGRGLDVYPDTMPEEPAATPTLTLPDVPCPNQSKGLSFWEAISLWLSGKPPCPKG